MRIKFKLIFLFIFFTCTIGLLSYAAPTGPGTINRGPAEQRILGVDNSSGGTMIQAQAGNVTALNINSTRVTSRWQGYYGNVTGTITLDDGRNNTLYDWQISSPQGEIYAANDSSVTWTNVYCFNYSNNLSAGSPIVQKFNGTELEAMIGASAGDRDSVNGTFNSTYTGTFKVGSTTINQNSGCKQVTLFVNDAYQTTRFKEVLLTDNSSIIYTSILEQDQTGFHGTTLDFEMIVGDNGDIGTATNYYFYVELA